MFQGREYHRESDDNSSKYYVRENDSSRDNRDNVSRDLLSISSGREPSYHGRDYHYKTSYNQGRDGGFQTGNRDYSRDGGNVEYSKVTKYSEDRNPSYGGASAAYAGGSAYSGTATVSRNYDNNDNDSRYYSRSDRYGDSAARNTQAQYSSSSSHPSQSYSSSYNRDNDRSRDQDSKGYYWQQTKTYHDGQPQGHDYAANRGYNVGYSSGGNSGSYGISSDASRNRNYDVYDSSRTYGGNDNDRTQYRSSNTDTSSRSYGNNDSAYRGNVSYSSSTGTGAGAQAGGSAYSSSYRY